ncbi:MAG: LuxR C-terminal-related transcriptional regulator [Polyangiaceae bacterium]
MSVEGPFQWRAVITALGHVTVVQGSVSAPVVLDVRAGSYVLHLSRGGVAVVAAGGASVPVAAGQSGALASPERRLRWASSSAYQGLTVRIAPAYVRSQLAALTGEEPRSDPEIALALAGGGAPAGVIERFCQFLAGELEHAGGVAHAGLANSLQEALVRTVLVSQPHDHSHLLRRPPLPSGEAAVRLAEEIVAAAPGASVGATELSEAACAPLLSVEAAFRKHRGKTLAAFRSERKLEHARDVLFRDPHISLSLLAQSAGFLREEPFEAAFFKKFGEPVARARARAIRVGPPPAAGSAAGPPIDRLGLLSARERQVCTLLSRGLLHKQVAAELGITERTVQEHRSRALKKLGIGSAAELARLLERRGE